MIGGSRRLSGGVTRDRTRVLVGPVPAGNPHQLTQGRVGRTVTVVQDPDGETVDPTVVEWTYRARTFGETDEMTKSPPQVVEADSWLRDIEVSAGSGSTTVEVFANGALVAAIPAGESVRRLDRWLYAGTNLQVRATSADAVNLTVDFIVEGA